MSTKYNRLILTLSFWMYFGSADTIDIQRLCGTTRMNRTQVCCGGQIHSRFQNSKEMACCQRSGKEELYPKHEKICCGEQLVHLVRHGNGQECCNKQLIDSQTYDCCGDENFGVPFAKTDINNECCPHYQKQKYGLYQYLEGYSCCGSLQFHKDKQECVYENQTYSVKERSPMMPCGKKDYNPAVTVCCRDTGKVITKPKENHHVHSIGAPPDWVCWNDELVDRNTNDFDRSTSRVIPKGSRLCGQEIYYPKNKNLKCCDSTLLKVDLSPEDQQNITCCGEQLLDLTDNSQQCCGNKIIPSAMKGCCNGIPFDKGHDLECCARTLINRSTDVCCMTQSSYRTVVKKQHVSHTNCCQSTETGRVLTYNEYEKVCERGEISNKVREGFTEVQTVTPNPDLRLFTRRKCPFCSETITETACNKLNVYRFFVYDKREKHSESTVLNGVILQPYRLKTGKAINGEKIKIRTRNLCRCFKMKKNFYLFTNRKIKNLKENKFNVRFTSDDVFIAEDNKESLVKCLTYQQIHSSKH